MMNEATAKEPVKQGQAMRVVLIITGCFIMATAPIVGVLPGPGGTIVFAFGLAITLRNSAWAKRIYVRVKKKLPKIGHVADWGLRRQSPKRRREVSKAAKRTD